MIACKDLSFRYQNAEANALEHIDLRINQGECIVLCGKSGCGKTTLIRLLNGLAPSFFPGTISGQCSVFGLKTGNAVIEDYVPKVGSVFQNPKTQYFNVDTTAELAFPCENMGMPSQEIRQRVEDYAAQFGLQHLLDRSIFKLSGGEKQRIAFGAACMLKPKLLVLDEPTSNLDYSAIEDLHNMIAREKAAGTTIVIAEHRLAWIKDIADRFCFFEDGCLAGQWTSDDFQKLPPEQLKAMGLRPLDIVPYHAQALEKSKLRPSDDRPLVSAVDLAVGYGKKHSIYQIKQFQISKGEIVGLMGHNGVGKSTFAQTLCGLLKHVSGKIYPTNKKERIKHSFLVMQDVNYQLFSDSVREEILLGAARPELCDQVLKSLGLLELADRHPMSLSGGQKQRVAIASAILSGKECIVLDEPTSGLDYYHMTQAAHLIQQLRSLGTAVLVITHDEELAAGWCDRVVYLHDKEK